MRRPREVHASAIPVTSVTPPFVSHRPATTSRLAQVSAPAAAAHQCGTAGGGSAGPRGSPGRAAAVPVWRGIVGPDPGASMVVEVMSLDSATTPSVPSAAAVAFL
ncbi:MAG: hypothetical protein M9891_17920 [Austwickia sp.]|nr:hypothetical protein [Austwickia sp.]